jgi:hypothetical protein
LGTVLAEEARDLGVALGDAQGRSAAGIGGVDVGAVGDEQLDHLFVTFLGGGQKSCTTGVIFDGGVGAIGQEQLDDVEVALGGGPDQGGAEATGGVGVRAGLEEPPDDLSAMGVDGENEGRKPVLVGLVEIRPGGNVKIDLIELAAAGGLVKVNCGGLALVGWQRGRAEKGTDQETD